MIIAATGHRPNKLNNEYDMRGPCSNYIRDQIQIYLDKFKPEKIISGMALGVDLIFALLALDNKIPVIAAVPFIGQERIWPDISKKIYFDVLNHPLVKITVISEGGYEAWKMIIRDHWMVDNSDLLIAVYNGDKDGGTAKTFQYATKMKKQIVVINPNDYPKENYSIKNWSI